MQEGFDVALDVPHIVLDGRQLDVELLLEVGLADEVLLDAVDLLEVDVDPSIMFIKSVVDLHHFSAEEPCDQRAADEEKSRQEPTHGFQVNLHATPIHLRGPDKTPISA
ncbi:hypothetical protein [Zavarzinella formosa]|uniref:hypothetical protein n=1 Tax=Zavarzinella formosa TaxID=360055 RepID=UPI000364DDC3|nr:hypothetical protein [Zavarzinella formosa]